jgi:hypothetical protein
MCSMSNFWAKRQYAETSTEPDGLSKRGYVYLLSEFFTIGSKDTILLGLSTNGTQVEFQFYDLTSTVHPVKAILVEAPTVTPVASAIVGRNLNRNVSDTHTVDFWTATSYTGGTPIASELVGSDAKAGGSASQSRVHVLKPNTDYLMSFENLETGSTAFHINLGWSEGEPNSPGLWETVP